MYEERRRRHNMLAINSNKILSGKEKYQTVAIRKKKYLAILDTYYFLVTDYLSSTRSNLEILQELEKYGFDLSCVPKIHKYLYMYQ